MKRRILFIVVCLFISAGIVFATEAPLDQEQKAEVAVIAPEMLEDEMAHVNSNELPDPLYPINFAMFYFNDKLQLWLLEPAAKGYKYATPEIFRLGVGNVFNNLRSPVNFLNNLLQFKLDSFGKELFRFVFNSTVGLGGICDVAYHLLDLKKQEADFGQTLGYYGVGQGIYLVWPIIGPSSLRETVGFLGDQVMSPPTYLSFFFLDFLQSSSVVTFEKINDTSFKLGDYSLLTNSSVDPYLALKNVFEQYRAKKIRQVDEH